MSNSPLVRCTKISPNKNSPRNHKIDTITIHCVVGQLSAESIGDCFTSPNTKASCNYGIGTDGRIVLCVDEKDRSWCSSSSSNDNRAITIECASDKSHPYAINDKVFDSLIELCVDICKRNGIKELKWEANKSLIGQPDKQNLTVHRWFANKSCPGDYIYNRLKQIALEVNSKLLKPNESEEDEMRYNKFSEIPDYAKPTIAKMIDKGFIGGMGSIKDSNGRPADMDLSTDMLRMFVINDRANVYGK